jgi:hypothetical protein
MTQSNDGRGEWTSASNASADRACPGRHLAQKGMPEVNTPDSEFGTQIHLALATGDMSKLTREQMEIADSCESIATAIAKGFFGESNVKIIAERRFWIKQRDALGEYMHSARVDRVYYDANKALIVEFKTLPGEVESSPENAQLRDQAMLVSGNIGASGVMLDMVACVICQPLSTHTPELCIYRKEDLERAEAELHERVVRSNDPGSPRIAGEVQCKFCRAKLGCPEHQAWIGRTLPMLPASIVDTPVSKWTGEQAAVFLDLRGVAGKWLTETYGSLKKRLKDHPDAIPGYSLRAGNEVDTVSDPQALLDRLTALTPGMDPQIRLKAFMKAVEIGNTKFKNVVGGLTGFKGQKLKDAVDKLFEGLVDTRQNDFSIVKSKTQTGQK